MKPPLSNSLQVLETAFEKRRGISRVESRTGFAQVHVSNLEEPLTVSRLQVLGAIGDGGISLDFLKMTQTGLSFLVTEESAEMVSQVLKPLGVHFSVRKEREILLVHAVNMRDEEGLIARIVLEAIACGVRVDHISDMHDRMLMVVAAEEAPKLRERIEEELMGVAHAH